MHSKASHMVSFFPESGVPTTDHPLEKSVLGQGVLMTLDKSIKRQFKAETDAAPLVSSQKRRKSETSFTKHESLLVSCPRLFHPASYKLIKVAAFDLDHTLISTRSGKRFPVDSSDWKWLHHTIPERLLGLSNSTFIIALFSNQNGVGLDESGMKSLEFTTKLESILAALDFPVFCFVATQKDLYRKPSPRMWDFFKDYTKSEIDMTNSFFVGDAAGRPKDWGPGKLADHSDVDRKFAINIGLQFYTPEEFFLNDSPFDYSPLIFNPKCLLESSENYVFNDRKEQEMIIFVGFPASGKTSFATKYIIPKGYVHINQDILKTRPKCLSYCQSALRKANSVVIDCTNPSKLTRSAYISFGLELRIPIRCFYFDINYELAYHLNMYRSLVYHVPPIPEVAYKYYLKNFELPDISEGFESIEKIKFIPKSVDDLQLFTSYLY